MNKLRMIRKITGRVIFISCRDRPSAPEALYETLEKARPIISGECLQNNRERESSNLVAQKLLFSCVTEYIEIIVSA